MTETSSMMTHVLGEGNTDQHPDSCGPAAPNCELKIVDPVMGARCQDGDIGLLLCRGLECGQGQLILEQSRRKRPRPSATAGLLTGDLKRAKLDAAGNLYIVDRAKDVIIRGGENIYSVEVEHALAGAPGIAEAAVIAVPDEVMGEKVGAVVVGRRRRLTSTR